MAHFQRITALASTRVNRLLKAKQREEEFILVKIGREKAAVRLFKEVNFMSQQVQDNSNNGDNADKGVQILRSIQILPYVLWSLLYK